MLALKRRRDKIATTLRLLQEWFSESHRGFRRSRIRAARSVNHIVVVVVAHDDGRENFSSCKAVSRSPLTLVSRSLYRRHVILLETACNRTFATRST